MKRLLFRVLLVAGVAFVPCCPDGYGLAKPPQAPPVKTAALVPEKDCGCLVGAPCVCGTDCACGAARLVVHARPAQAPSERPGPVEWALYRLAYERAVGQNRPLIIWVGETCPSCEASWPEYVHARLSEYDGPPYETTPYRGPGVILAKPDGLGGMDRLGTLSGVPSRDQVKALLYPAPAPAIQDSFGDYHLGTRAAGVAAPFFLPMPMMGGGCGGGGCGGGG